MNGLRTRAILREPLHPKYVDKLQKFWIAEAVEASHSSTFTNTSYELRLNIAVCGAIRRIKHSGVHSLCLTGGFCEVCRLDG